MIVFFFTCQIIDLIDIHRKIFFQREQENLLSCLSTLFDVEEFKIQEDLIQISELVYIDRYFINRSTSLNQTDHSLPESYKRFFTEYLGSPALLSEAMSGSGVSTGESFIKDRLNYWQPRMGFWSLGASYYDTLRIDAKSDLRCGEHSCYEQSLKRRKICKPGMLLYKIFQLNTLLRVYK